MKRTCVFLVVLSLLLSMCGLGLAQSDVVDEKGRIVRYGEPVHLTAYFCRSMPRFNEGDDINHNVWIQRYKDLYNIELEIVVLANGDDYKQKMTMAIASNKLPDLMYLDGNQYTQLAKAGKLADITDLFDLYCGDILRKTLMGKDGKVFQQSYVDGRLYGFTKTKGMIWPGSQLYIRKDWLKNLGLEEPKTFDDVVKIAYAFANDDPDGNGKKDTYGLGLNNDMLNATDYGSLQGVVAAFGGFTSTWILDEASTQVSYGALNAGTKQGLEVLAKMYREFFALFNEATVNRNNKMIHDLHVYIEEHLNGDLSLSRLGEVTSYNPAYLSALYKKITGYSLIDHINRIRIEKAKSLLKENNARVRQVALACGFESQQYFNKLFKQQCNMTPNEYRMQTSNVFKSRSSDI